MISEKFILEKIREWSKTPSGKETLKRQAGVDHLSSAYGKSDVKRKEISNYGNKMRDILFKYVNPLIKSIEITDIIVSEPIKTKGGEYLIKVSFREGSLHRESLSSRYPEGLSNIVLLFSKGYTATKKVRGVWKKPSGDETVWSRQSRESNDFLSNAVDEFNSIADGIATAELQGVYSEDD